MDEVGDFGSDTSGLKNFSWKNSSTAFAHASRHLTTIILAMRSRWISGERYVNLVEEYIYEVFLCILLNMLASRFLCNRNAKLQNQTRYSYPYNIHFNSFRLGKPYFRDFVRFQDNDLFRFVINDKGSMTSMETTSGPNFKDEQTMFAYAEM